MPPYLVPSVSLGQLTVGWLSPTGGIGAFRLHGELQVGRLQHPLRSEDGSDEGVQYQEVGSDLGIVSLTFHFWVLGIVTPYLFQYGKIVLPVQYGKTISWCKKL